MFILLFFSILCHTTYANAGEDRARYLLDQLLKRVDQDPEGFAADIRNSPIAAIVPTFPIPPPNSNVKPNVNLPTVLGHGMGDSCFNGGMKSITKAVGVHQNSYSVCVPTGNNSIMDTINGFIMNMDRSVEVFTKKIRADKNLAGGFNAIGFSQGNSLIRGYIQKYNDPPVSNFLSVHGTIKGVSGIPECNPANPIEKVICAPLVELLGEFAYLEFVQEILFQADYFDDPTKRNATLYQTNSQIANWNQEGVTNHSEYKTNFLKVKKYIMIKALKDTMVYPNENEWWGGFEDGGFDKVLTMKETDEYKRDTFGLQSADKLKKLFFNHTEGGHLEFSNDQLYFWIDQFAM